MNLADVLSGSAGLEGIRWMLTGTPRRALRRELTALLTVPGMLGPCRLRRARFKPGRKFRAFYDAHLRGGGDGTEGVRPIVVTWKLNGEGHGRDVSSELAALEAEAMRRGLTVPFKVLAADAPAWGMHVRISPLDASFPHLVRLCDPQYVRDMVRGASDGGPDQVKATRYSVTFVRYRPDQRHLLRYDLLDAPEHGALFAKLYSTSEEGGRVFHLAERVQAWLEQRGEGVTSVRPFGYVAEDAVGLYSQVVGTPLPECLRRPSKNLAGSLRDTGAALYALHQLPEAVAGPLELHDFAGEVKEIGRKSEHGSEHISALLPPVGAALEALLKRAQELSERLPQEPPTFTHGDFKAEHVWVTAKGLTLIDFDSCRWGDPALDIGKFLADLRFLYEVYGQRGLKQAQEQFLAGYGPSAPTERLLRARLYEAIGLVKLTIRRVDMFDCDWEGKTEHLIGCAQAALNDFELSLGSAKRGRD